MKALSLWRPWPWAFFRAGKRVENRSWPPPKSIIESPAGVWVAMHAAKRFDDDAAHRMVLGDFGDAAKALPLRGDLDHPIGIVGAFLVRGAVVHGPGHLGDPWAFGPWVWETPLVVQFREPIQCKGRQGLWTVPAELEPIVRRSIEAGRVAA